MDVSLEEPSQAEDFKSDEPMPNIWTIDEDEETQNDEEKVVTSDELDNEAPEEPSFLRRLKRYTGRKTKKDDSKEEKS